LALTFRVFRGIRQHGAQERSLLSQHAVLFFRKSEIGDTFWIRLETRPICKPTARVRLERFPLERIELVPNGDGDRHLRLLGIHVPADGPSRDGPRGAITDRPSGSEIYAPVFYIWNGSRAPEVWR